MSGSKYFLADIVFLSVCVLATTLPWASGLGFYADDWQITQTFQTCPHQDTLGLYNCIAMSYRPVQFLELVVLYQMFGSNPLGYHISNALLLLLVILALYSVLYQFGVPPPALFSIPLLYAFLPHFSTDRFWPTVPAALCLLLYLSAVIAARKAVAAEHLSWWWVAGSVALLVLSAAAYEVAVPLFVLIPIMIWPRLSQRQVKFVVAFSLLLMGATIGVKLIAQNRTHFQLRFLQHPLLVATHTAVETWKSNYGEYGLGLPYTAWRAAASNPGRASLAAAACLGLAVFAYLLWRLRRCATWPLARYWSIMAAFGLLIFLLSYSIFVADVTKNSTSTGIRNRVMIAAALGTAVSLVAMIGLIAAMAPAGRWRSLVFSGGISVLAAGGFVIINVIATYWTEAAALQQKVIAGVTAAFPTAPAGKVLILDGVCAWDGPGLVFETGEDVSAMLQRVYRNASLTGDTVGGGMRLMPEGLYTSYYGYETKHDFGDNLVTLDLRDRTVTRLTDYQTARSHFERRPLVCPAGSAGDGSRIF